MLLPLCGVVLAEVPAGWTDAPVAWGLHPVGWHVGVRYQELVEDVLAGPRASPVFSQVVAEADVHWRLRATWDEGLPLDGEDAERWRDTALAGALLAGTRVVDEAVSRQAEVHVAFSAVDAVLNPSLELARTPAGELRVAHRVGGPAASRVARAEAEEVLDRPGSRGPPRPAVDLGFDWRLREEDDPVGTPVLDYAVFVSTRSVLVDNLRLDLLALAGDWSVTGRVSVYPRVYLVASARSLNAELSPRTPWASRAEPGRWSVGWMWTVPQPAGWTVRFDRSTTLAPTPSVTWTLSLRGEFGAALPGRPVPALGARDDEPAWLPAVPERGPNHLRVWGAPPPASPAPSPGRRPGGTANEGCAAPGSPGRR